MFRRIAGEPLVHFLLIGLIVFAVYSARDDSSSVPDPETIIVSQAKVDQLASRFEAIRRRAPSSEERTALVEDFIREEVLVREALALGLDREDAVLRRRLRQKMQFLVDSSTSALQPDEKTLRDHYEANADRFSTAARLAFEQVFLGEAPSDEDVAPTLKALEDGADPGGLSAPSDIPPTMPLSGAGSVDRVFGPGFFASIADYEPDRWEGPVKSAIGLHLVRIAQKLPATLPSFDTVRDAVEADWSRGRTREQADAQYESLRNRYEIVLPDERSAD